MKVKEVKAITRCHIRIEKHDEKGRLIAQDLTKPVDEEEVKELGTYSDGGCKYLLIVI